MKQVFRQTPLYRFLLLCNNEQLEKKILDCGAGGNCPPLALFANHGYETYGIEIDDDQLKKKDVFEQENNLQLNIKKGDMTSLPYEDESISYIYSYNTIFHMKKSDIDKAMGEIKRVLKPGGLCFVNFLSVDDFGYGEGKEIGKGEYLQNEGEDKVIHTYFEHNEAEKYFEDMEFVLKETRILERMYEGERIKQGYIDYIVKK